MKYSIDYGRGGKSPARNAAEVGQFIAYLLRSKETVPASVTVTVTLNEQPKKSRKKLSA